MGIEFGEMPSRPLRHYRRITGDAELTIDRIRLSAANFICRKIADFPARRLAFPNINSAGSALGVSS
jgi:hypothetical protein